MLFTIEKDVKIARNRGLQRFTVLQKGLVLHTQVLKQNYKKTILTQLAGSSCPELSKVPKIYSKIRSFFALLGSFLDGEHEELASKSPYLCMLKTRRGKNDEDEDDAQQPRGNRSKRYHLFCYLLAELLVRNLKMKVCKKHK